MSNVINEQQFPKELEDWKKKSKSLWYLGNLKLLDKPKVSVIGTRGVSQPGVSRTKNITKILVDNGFVVVSGMAKGVDTVAHETALEMSGSTIAVMGTPINKCYPRENDPLKREIAKKGLVISQFEPNSKTHKSNFPHRNELMAALSDLTIVIEAGEKSGTRYQVDYAIKMKRKVGFLASLAKRNVSWVSKALNSGFGFIVTEPDDLIKILNGKKIAPAQPELTFEEVPSTQHEAAPPQQVKKRSRFEKTIGWINQKISQLVSKITLRLW